MRNKNIPFSRSNNISQVDTKLNEYDIFSMYCITRPNLYMDLTQLIAEANRLIHLYYESSSNKLRELIKESYFKVCKAINTLRTKIKNHINIQQIKTILKIAANFKSLINYQVRNLKHSYRKIIKFLFKNMDDNSGDVMLYILNGKTLCHTKATINEKK